MLWNGLRVISTLQLYSKFIFQLNNDRCKNYGFWNYFYKNN